VDDLFLVRRTQPLRDLQGKVEGLPKGKLSVSFALDEFTIDPFTERQAIDIFHHDERLLVHFIDLVNRADVGMVQARCGLRFEEKALLLFPLFREMFREEFNGDGALQPGVFGFIDDAHASLAEFIENRVMRNLLSDHVSVADKAL
jgi:hypothetical protein